MTVRRARRSALLAGMALASIALAGCVPAPPAVELPATDPASTDPAPTEADPSTAPSTEPANENDVPELVSVPTADLLPGHCIAGLPVDPGHGSLTVVPCADMHNAEVITTRESDEEEFPGDSEMQGATESWCSDLLPAIVNGVPDSSLYAVAYPTEESWQEGDRFMVCFLRAFDAYYTGSFVGGDGEVHTD